MTEEPQVRPGFLPPKAPAGGVPVPAQPERPTFVTQRTESGARNPLAISGTIVGSISILLLVFSFGVGWSVCGAFSFVGLMLGRLARQQIMQKGEGRAGQARAAIWVGGIGLALSLVAAITWLALEANGITNEDLRDWLERQLEAQRARD
jgi:hypothetical protein